MKAKAVFRVFNRLCLRVDISTKRRIAIVALTFLFGFTVIWHNHAKAQRCNPNRIERAISWKYNGVYYSEKFTFNIADYNFYRNLQRPQSFSAYPCEYTGHRYLNHIVEKLKADAPNEIRQDSRFVEFVTAFVQAIPYQINRYPKYPIETLVEHNGDCKAKSVLLAALLKDYGYDMVLVELPHHLAVAIGCSTCEKYYLHNGKRYTYIETTATGWQVGNIPDEMSKADALLIDIPNLRQTVWSALGERINKVVIVNKKR